MQYHVIIKCCSIKIIITVLYCVKQQNIPVWKYKGLF